MKFLVVALVLLSTANASAEELAKPALPDSATYSLGIGSHIRTFGDTSAANLATDSIAGPRLTLGRSLTNARAYRQIDIGVFARYSYATVSGTVFKTLETDIEQHALAGGLRVDAPLWWRTRLVAQAELGMLRTKLQVVSGDTMPVDDHSWAPYATATLGADLALLQNPKFRFALGFDVGYMVTRPVDLQALPGDRPDEQLSIATEFASIGKLDTRGWTTSLAFRASF